MSKRPLPAKGTANASRDLQGGVDLLGKLRDGEGLLDEAFCTGFEQLLNLFLLYHAAHYNYLDVLKLGVLPDCLADHIAVNIGQHVVKQNQVRSETLCHHAGLVSAGSSPRLKSAVVREDVVHKLDYLGVIVNNEHFLSAGLEIVGGNAVVPHELDEILAGNPAKLGAWDAETLQTTGIETANDRLLTYSADFGGLAGGK